VSEAPRVRPVSFAERVATTVLVPALVLLLERVPLPHVDASTLERGSVAFSPFAVGLGPFITAFSLVELAALVVPPWRRWRHDARGRARLTLWATALALLLAVVQAFGIAMSLEGLDVVTNPGWQTRVVLTATIAGGACALAVVARWATRRGLLNGYVLVFMVPVVAELARGDALRDAAFRGGARAAVLVAVALAAAVGATLVAVSGGLGLASAVRVDGSAYRGDQKSAPRAEFPIPVSSITPVTVASSILMSPALLANLGFPGMGALQATLQRGDVVFDTAYALLIVGMVLVASALLYRPAEVSAFVRRLGSVSDDVARADTTAALRRALLPTFAYLLALVLAMMAARSKSGAVPAIAAVAIATGGVLDLARSLAAHARARDLVCVAELHDAYQVAALRAALRAEGIDARARGMAVLSLLQGFAPYAPVELHVRAGDVERASALLRHWAAGDAKPAAPATSPAEETRVPWSLGIRTAVLAALAALALGVDLVPREEPAAPGPRPEIAVVRVDDETDPLASVHDDDAPEGVALYQEMAPLGQGRPVRRTYARASLRKGESLQAAWARVLPWLPQLPPGENRRWAWEPVLEPLARGDDDDDGRPPRFVVVGLRTLLLMGDVVVGTKDVEDAAVGRDKDGWQSIYVTVTLTPEAGERFYQLTQEWVGRRLAIVIDDHVDSAPVIRSPIPGGRISVTMGSVGDRDKQLADAKRLAGALRRP